MINIKYSTQFLPNVSTIKKFNDELYKITGIKCTVNPDYDTERKFTEKGQAGNDEKLENNISRSKQIVYELAMCNQWEYFVTFTLSPEKYNRYDIIKFKKDLSRFIRNYSNRKCDNKIKYLLVPEMHKDGAWHMHGFMMGLSENDIELFTLDMKIPIKIKNRLKAGIKVYYWQSYWNKFGFNDIEKIENHDAVCKYVMKYINKEMSRSVSELNAHMFYCSKGLKRAELLYRSFLCKQLDEPQFQNEYVAFKFTNNLEDAKLYIEG